MKKLFTLILLITTALATAIAQEQLTKRQLADKLFERYEYSKSLKLYMELEGKKKYDLTLIERIADCYREMGQYEEAEKWYAEVLESEKADNINRYYYAEILLRNKNFEAARKIYKQYYDARTGNTDELKRKLAACDSAEAWIKEGSGYVVKNEESLNSSYSEWGLTYYGASKFIFTSDRKTTDSKKDKYAYPWTGNGYFKLFEAEGTKLTELPIDLKSSGLVTGDYHVGPIALNAAQDTAYITITTVVPKREFKVSSKLSPNKQRLYTRRLQLVMATKKDGQWGNFKNFAYNNINQYSIGHAALSGDGKLLYFTSDMPDGFGGTDIWFCEKQSNGTWGKPVNCGKDINTIEDEAFPTLNGDDVLFYSSKGLPGMGGYDLFEAHGSKTNWAKPEHLPYPINSTSDDFWYISKDGLTGYFSSDRENGAGNDDIYSFSIKSPKVPKKAKPKPQEDIAGPVTPITPVKTYQTGDVFVLNNIYYDLDKSNIRPDAAIELDKLATILKEHPTIRIELSSHTDSRASDAYNMALSQRRAASAVAYLVAHGIAKNRMVAKGYGETRLVNQCSNGVPCTEAEHQLNRRTEVKILSQ